MRKKKNVLLSLFVLFFVVVVVAVVAVVVVFCFCFEKAVNSISAYSEVTCCSNLDLFAKTSPVLINFRRSTYQVLALWPKLTVDWLVSLSRVIGCRVLEASRPADTDR